MLGYHNGNIEPLFYCVSIFIFGGLWHLTHVLLFWFSLFLWSLKHIYQETRFCCRNEIVEDVTQIFHKKTWYIYVHMLDPTTKAAKL